MYLCPRAVLDSLILYRGAPQTIPEAATVVRWRILVNRRPYHYSSDVTVNSYNDLVNTTGSFSQCQVTIVVVSVLSHHEQVHTVHKRNVCYVTVPLFVSLWKGSNTI